MSYGTVEMINTIQSMFADWGEKFLQRIDDRNKVQDTKIDMIAQRIRNNEEEHKQDIATLSNNVMMLNSQVDALKKTMEVFNHKHSSEQSKGTTAPSPKLNEGKAELFLNTDSPGADPFANPLPNPKLNEGAVASLQSVERTRDGFSMWAENSFRDLFPDKYEELRETINFDPHYFTANTDFIPVYVDPVDVKPKIKLHKLGRNQIMLNETLWGAVPETSKANLRKQTDRMVAINDPGFRPRRNMEGGDINNLVQVTGTTARVNRRSDNADLINVIKKAGVAFVPRASPDSRLARRLPNSVIKSDIIRIYPRPLEDINTLSERAFFNGLILQSTYEVNNALLTGPSAFNSDSFRKLIRRAIIQNVNTDIKDPDNVPPYYNIFLYYVGYDNNGQAITRRLKTNKEISDVNDLNASQALLFADTFSEHIQDVYGSDVREVLENNLTIDYSRFDIEKVDVSRSGGGSRALSEIGETSSTHGYKKIEYSWGRVRDYNSKNSGCFLKILSEVLKAHKVVSPKTNKPWRYTTLWEYLDKEFKTKTFKLPVTLEWADKASQYFGLYLIINNEVGEVTYTCTSPDLKCEPKNTLRVLLDKEHYYHIVRWYDFSIYENRPRYEIRTVKKDPPCRHYINVYYDLETVNTVEPGSETFVVPYANAWAIDINDVQIQLCDRPNPFSVFDAMITDIINDFNCRCDTGQLEVKDGVNTHVFYRFIAYNGSRFDHALLFLYLISAGWHCIEAPSATGKVRSFKFYLGDRKIPGTHDIARHFLEIWDPCLYTNQALSTVTESFGLQHAKGSLNHNEVQEFYAEGKLGEYLNKHSAEIEEYNRTDVEVLRDLVSHLEDYFTPTMYKFPTISALCYDTWKKLLNRSFKVSPVKDYNIDAFIRTAIIGGRVEGQIGEHNKDFKMYDVVSLYPFVMRSREYPVGEEKILKTVTSAKKYFKNDEYIGLYYVEYDQSPMNTPHPYLPLRDDNNSLNWTDKSKGVSLLPDITIKDLLDANAKVTFVKGPLQGPNPGKELLFSAGAKGPSNDIAGIVWKRSAPGVLFKEYIDIYSKQKKDEDRKKMEGKPFNATVRELSKLQLNALSGKMSQRNFTTRSKLWTSETELREHIKEAVTNGNYPIPYIACKNAIFTVDKKSPEKAYSNAHPSQIGVFIYAYARSYMWNLFFSKMKVYYSDTDSALIDAKDSHLLPSELIVKQSLKEFGMLECEALPNRAIIIAPKNYLLLNDMTPIKYRIKGVRSSDSWLKDDNKLIISESILEFFEHLLQHNETKVVTWSFRNLIKDGRLEHREIIKTIRPNVQGSVAPLPEQSSEGISYFQGF